MSVLNPVGIDIAGWPVKLNCMVFSVCPNVAEILSYDEAVFRSKSGGAVKGTVGKSSASNLSKIASYSWRTVEASSFLAV